MVFFNLHIFGFYSRIAQVSVPFTTGPFRRNGWNKGELAMKPLTRKKKDLLGALLVMLVVGLGTYLIYKKHDYTIFAVWCGSVSIVLTIFAVVLTFLRSEKQRLQALGSADLPSPPPPILQLSPLLFPFETTTRVMRDGEIIVAASGEDSAGAVKVRISVVRTATEPNPKITEALTEALQKEAERTLDAALECLSTPSAT